MKDLTDFNYERFLSLKGHELFNYVEPFVNMQSGSIPEDTYGHLEFQLMSMDEEHLAYALEICMQLNSNEFIRHVIGFVSHSDAAVCCAAYNAVNRLMPTAIPDDVSTKLAFTPIVDLFAPDLRSSKRICVGTNEVFIRDLVTKFTPKTSDQT